MDADVQRILEVYRRSGPRPRQVTPRIVDLPNGRVDVVYTINEGDKTGVKEIRFVGNNQVSSSRLRGVMADDRDEPPELPQEHRRLRSGPDRRPIWS